MDRLHTLNAADDDRVCAGFGRAALTWIQKVREPIRVPEGPTDGSVCSENLQTFRTKSMTWQMSEFLLTAAGRLHWAAMVLSLYFQLCHSVDSQASSPWVIIWHSDVPDNINTATLRLHNLHLCSVSIVTCQNVAERDPCGLNYNNMCWFLFDAHCIKHGRTTFSRCNSIINTTFEKHACVCVQVRACVCVSVLTPSHASTRCLYLFHQFATRKCWWMLKPESRQAGAFHSQSNLNEETKQIIKKAVQHVAVFFTNEGSWYREGRSPECSLFLCFAYKKSHVMDWIKL